MITLAPLPRRIVYVASFETLAIICATLLLASLSGGAAHSNLPVAIIASTTAVVWNFIYNTLFERWEKTADVTRRSLSLRVVHAMGFEGGLVVILIPIFMWWYQVGLWTALAMEAALLIFFLVFTFVFTWVFDQIVARKEPAPI
jgi:uncharacterized membrane protein